MLRESSMKTPPQPTSCAYRDALRADIQTLYNTGYSCEDSEIPTLTELVRKLVDDGSPTNRHGLVLWAIETLGNGLRSQTAANLLGVHETRGLSKGDRWKACAALSDKYASGDSFRNGKVRGRLLIDVILDELASRLAGLADKHKFHYGPNAEHDTPLSSDRRTDAVLAIGDRTATKHNHTAMPVKTTFTNHMS